MKIRKWILVTGCVMAAAGWYVSQSYPTRIAARPSESACINNLRQIDGAAATWALETKAAPGDIPSDADLFGDDRYIRRKPECPDGGRYVIGSGNRRPTCSVPHHSLERGDIHVTDPAGNPIQGAVVTLRDSIGVYSRGISDNRGFIHLEGSTGGPEFVQASCPGKQDARWPLQKGWPARLVLQPR